MNIIVLHLQFEKKEVCVNADGIKTFMEWDDGSAITMDRDQVFVTETPEEIRKKIKGNTGESIIHIPKSWSPKIGESYYTPIYSGSEGFTPREFRWEGCGFDKNNLSRGICLRRDDCVTLCKEMNSALGEVLERIEKDG